MPVASSATTKGLRARCQNEWRDQRTSHRARTWREPLRLFRLVFCRAAALALISVFGISGLFIEHAMMRNRFVVTRNQVGTRQCREWLHIEGIDGLGVCVTIGYRRSVWLSAIASMNWRARLDARIMTS